MTMGPSEEKAVSVWQRANAGTQAEQVRAEAADRTKRTRTKTAKLRNFIERKIKIQKSEAIYS